MSVLVSELRGLPMPPWFTRHGEVEVICFVDMDDTSFQAKCLRHYTSSGYIFGRGDFEKAERWRCPDCVREAREHERETRDD